nr:proline dehydrogenase family protein [Paenibacillus phyllosphaerae]
MKSIARRADLKAYVEHNPQLYQLLRRAAARYVTGDDRRDGLEAAASLTAQGYDVSLEYIGENTATEAECEAAVRELSGLIAELAGNRRKARVSFDLSHIGLSLHTDLALRNLLQLAEQAEPAGIELFISMEESAKTDRVLDVYERSVARYPSSIGITLQAQLHRTAADLAQRLPGNSLVRIVKGAYQESEQSALPRSEQLNRRYLELVEHAILQGHRVSIATHDQQIIDTILTRGWLSEGAAEFEMLYGIRTELSRKLKAAGHPVRIYLTYGSEWYLYICHRIAEHPPNLYRAVIDMASGESVDPVNSYAVSRDR